MTQLAAFCNYIIPFIIECLVLDCNCIATRGGVYDEILPEPKGNPEGTARGISQGSGNISSYTLTEVTIQSFSITSTSQYFDKRISFSCDINMMVAKWGEMHPQKVVGFQPLPHTWPPEYDIFLIQKCALFIISI